MKISICLPVMGRGPMLTQALYSILAQNCYDVELIIKDGDPEHPVRDYPSVSRALSCFDPQQINYEVGRDGGIFPAVNNCLRRATGDILYFMCSDDLLCPGAFQAVNEIFEYERFGGAFWLYGKTISADETGKTLGIDGGVTTFEELCQHNRLGQPSVFWNRQMMNLVGMFDSRFRFAADYDLWLHFWRQRAPHFLDQTLGIFRHHEGSDTQIHPTETNAMAAKVSWRHTNMGAVISRARNRRITEQAFGDKLMPVAHDDEEGFLQACRIQSQFKTPSIG